MKNILRLMINDLKQVFRDRMLIIFLFTPLLLLLFTRYFVPYLGEVYPVVKSYYPPILMFGAVQTSIMFGFISAFIMLEEKDENVMQAIRVLPISPERFVIFRLLFSTLFSGLAALLIILASGLAWPGWTNALLLSIQYALAAPFIALIVATFAKNKIEGLAFFKGVDLLIILPIVGILLESTWKYTSAFVPMFWTYELFDHALQEKNIFLPFFTGLAIYFLEFLFLMQQFKKRVF